MTYGNRSASSPNRGMDEMALVVKSQCSFRGEGGKTFRPGDEVDPESAEAKTYHRKLMWVRRAFKDFVEETKAKGGPSKAAE